MISRLVMAVLLMGYASVWHPSLLSAQTNQNHYNAAAWMLHLMEYDKQASKIIQEVLIYQARENPKARLKSPQLKQKLESLLLSNEHKQRLIQMIMQEFNEEELRTMVQFYRSDVGQKALKKMPVLSKRTMEMTQQLLRKHKREFDAIMRQ